MNDESPVQIDVLLSVDIRNPQIRNYQQDGQQREETEWFSVVTWNRLAETCAQYLVKGRTVYVEGRLQTRSWDDQATGTKRYRTELIAEEVKFLGGRDGGGGGGGGGFAPGMAVGADSEGDIDPDELPF